MAEVKLSQASYDEVLEDIEELRLQSDTYFELWQNARLKAEAFDEIDDLIFNGALKDREPNAIFQNICHVIINFKERGSDVEV